MSLLSVSMLGGTGVGKTSLLAAMYDQFDANIGGANLQLTPDLESNALLGESLANLKKLVYRFDSDGQSVKSTTAKREFLFGLGKPGEHPSLTLRFVDYPGGYIESRATRAEKEEVFHFLLNSAVIVVAIDAPALMEDRGRWNEMVNKPSIILGLFKNAYQNLSGPRLVILAPIKCEKYLKSRKKTAELLSKVKQTNAKLLKQLASPSLRDNVAVVITPVQTVGSVYFSRIQRTNDEPIFYYRAAGHDAVYNPRDSEQPLRYLLRFLLRLHHQEQSQSWGMFSFVRYLLRMDSHLLAAVSKFAQASKTSGGFEIVQGHHLL